MKLEVGKKYKRRDGEIVEIFEKSVGANYPFCSDRGHYYTEGGNYWFSGRLDSYDLVEEYIEPQKASEQKDQGEKTFNICIDFYDDRVWSIDFCRGKSEKSKQQIGDYIVGLNEDFFTSITDTNGRVHVWRLKDVKSFTISEE